MIAWAAQTFVAFTLLLILVLALRRPVARFCGAEWAYALWLLPLLRVFLPPLPVRDGELSSVLPPAAAFIPAVTEAAAPSIPAAAGHGELSLLILSLWFGGAAIFVLWQQATHGAFLLSLRSNRRPGDPDNFGGIPVIESNAVDGPVAIGLLEREIVVPTDFATRYGPAERRLALEHELTHHRRRDIWWNMAALLLLGLNWFNPIAWIAFRAFRADQELSCDARVAARATVAERHDYACALVKSATRPGLVAGCPLNHADQLKRRLRMMRSHRRSGLRMAGGVAVTGAAILGGLGLTASAAATRVATQVQAEASEKVASAIKAVAAPMPAHLPLAVAAPAAPAPAAAPVRVALHEERRPPRRLREHRPDRPLVRSFRIHRGGKAPLVEMMGPRPECQEFRRGTDGDDKRRLVVCGRNKKLSPAEAEDLLEAATERSAEAKERVKRMRERLAEMTAKHRKGPSVVVMPRVPPEMIMPHILEDRLALHSSREALERERRMLDTHRRSLERHMRQLEQRSREIERKLREEERETD